MAQNTRTGTSITPVFSSPDLSVYRMFVSNVPTAYDGDGGRILKDIWCVKNDAIDTFYWHCDDFRSALAELKIQSSNFHSILQSRLAEFSAMIAYAMDLGRVVSHDPLWDEFIGIDDTDRDQQLENELLTFTCVQPATLSDPDSRAMYTRYNYNVDSDVLTIVERHEIQNDG